MKVLQHLVALFAVFSSISVVSALEGALESSEDEKKILKAAEIAREKLAKYMEKRNGMDHMKGRLEDMMTNLKDSKTVEEMKAKMASVERIKQRVKEHAEKLKGGGKFQKLAQAFKERAKVEQNEEL